MRKNLLLFLTLIVSTVILNAQKVEINGILKNNNYYDTIYISSFIQDANSITATPINEDGSFKFSINVSHTDFYRIWTDEKNFALLILSPKEKVKFTADATDLFNSFTVDGSKQTELFLDANTEFSQFQITKDSLKIAFDKQLQLIELKEQNFALNYVKKNKSSLSALMYIDRIDKEKYFDVYKMVDSALIIEYPTNKLVNDFHREVQRMNFMSINSVVSDIELADASGNKIALKSLRGKVVLIDFWATWCGPCKQEIPNLKKTYADYKDKGFEIYSISLDKKRDAWEAEQGKLPWINVLDADGKVAQEFNVVSIPYTILIDKEGKIIAKNVRGSDLYMRVSDLLD